MGQEETPQEGVIRILKEQLAELDRHQAITEALGEVEQKRRLEHIIVVHPDRKALAKRVAEKYNPAMLPRIISNSAVKPGMMIVIDEAELQRKTAEFFDNYNPFTDS